MSFFSRISDPCGSRHKTKSWISDPNGSLALLQNGSMIPVDLSANCEGRIYDPNGSGIQILGIRSRDPFSGSTDMSAHDTDFITEKPRRATGVEPAIPGIQVCVSASRSCALVPRAIVAWAGGRRVNNST